MKHSTNSPEWQIIQGAESSERLYIDALKDAERYDEKARQAQRDADAYWDLLDKLSPDVDRNERNPFDDDTPEWRLFSNGKTNNTLAMAFSRDAQRARELAARHQKTYNNFHAAIQKLSLK